MENFLNRESDANYKKAIYFERWQMTFAGWGYQIDRMILYPSIHPSIHPSIYLLVGHLILLNWKRLINKLLNTDTKIRVLWFQWIMDNRYSDQDFLHHCLNDDWYTIAKVYLHVTDQYYVNYKWAINRQVSAFILSPVPVRCVKQDVQI